MDGEGGRALIQSRSKESYAYGFESEIESEALPAGLSEETIREISRRKKEPSFLLDFRLKAYAHFLTLSPPRWGNLSFLQPDLQAISYFSVPKSASGPKSLSEVDPKLLEIYERLGVPLSEQKVFSGVAVDAVFDSVSVATTFQEELKKHGILFSSFSKAALEHPELVEQYLGSVVSYTDNYYAALNSAVFSDGSFCYIPKGVRCPMDLSTYFRINAAKTGQFERTLIIAEEGSEVNYLEGCTAPIRDENPLHAAVVEIYAHERAKVNYSTIQNWYPGDEEGRGGVYNLVTKRGLCAGREASISWTQVETGAAVTWKYPSVILKGEGSSGQFYSVALTKHRMQADTGTKMIHLAPNTKSVILSKGIATSRSRNTFRSLVKMSKNATGAKNHSQCDSLLVGSQASVFTFPQLDMAGKGAQIEHEASNSKVSEAQLSYLASRGLSEREATMLVITGFCHEVFERLPLEFAAEVRALLEIVLEDSIG